MGSMLPLAMALARRYIWLLVAPFASSAEATTAQLRISVVIEQKLKDSTNLGNLGVKCEAENRH